MRRDPLPPNADVDVSAARPMTVLLSSDSITVIVREGSRGGAVTSAYNARVAPVAPVAPRLSPPRHAETRRTPSPPPCIAFLRPFCVLPRLQGGGTHVAPIAPNAPNEKRQFPSTAYCWHRGSNAAQWDGICPSPPPQRPLLSHRAQRVPTPPPQHRPPRHPVFLVGSHGHTMRLSGTKKGRSDAARALRATKAQ